VASPGVCRWTCHGVAYWQKHGLIGTGDVREGCSSLPDEFKRLRLSERSTSGSLPSRFSVTLRPRSWGMSISTQTCLGERRAAQTMGAQRHRESPQADSLVSVTSMSRPRLPNPDDRIRTGDPLNAIQNWPCPAELAHKHRRAIEANARCRPAGSRCYIPSAYPLSDPS
jgi:hypothetical protein